MDCEHTEGPLHDCASVEQRNRMIPFAEAKARAAVVVLGDVSENKQDAEFNRVFHATMNALCQ